MIVEAFIPSIQWSMRYALGNFYFTAPVQMLSEEEVINFFCRSTVPNLNQLCAILYKIYKLKINVRVSQFDGFTRHPNLLYA